MQRNSQTEKTALAESDKKGYVFGNRREKGIRSNRRNKAVRIAQAVPPS